MTGLSSSLYYCFVTTRAIFTYCSWERESKADLDSYRLAWGYSLSSLCEVQDVAVAFVLATTLINAELLRRRLNTADNHREGMLKLMRFLKRLSAAVRPTPHHGYYTWVSVIFYCTLLYTNSVRCLCTCSAAHCLIWIPPHLFFTSVHRAGFDNSLDKSMTFTNVPPFNGGSQ